MDYTSFERVRAALEHREADRVPFDIGGAAVTGININALKNLRALLGLDGEPEMWSKPSQLAWTGADVIERLRIDVKHVGPNPPSNPGLARNVGHEDGAGY